jgi:hypothetical protein
VSQYDGTSLLREIKSLSSNIRGNLFPEEVSYTIFSGDGGKVLRKELWKLKEFKAIANPKSIQTAYKLEPGYTLKVYSSQGQMDFNADELLRYKKK